MRHLLAMLTACALAACGHTPLAPTTPHWDARFGDNARATLARQVIDPAAGARAPANAAGIDAGAARAGYERYQRSFSGAAAQAPKFMISGDGK